jgi:hypothetical protein
LKPRSLDVFINIIRMVTGLMGIKNESEVTKSQDNFEFYNIMPVISPKDAVFQNQTEKYSGIVNN